MCQALPRAAAGRGCGLGSGSVDWEALNSSIPRTVLLVLHSPHGSGRSVLDVLTA